MPDPLLDDLCSAAGTRHVLTDPGLTSTYERDWTGRFEGRSACVVRPGSTEEVAAVLGVCSRHRAPLVPQGGNTGLAGGGVPRGGEVVLSTTRLTSLEPVDVAAAQATAGAGVTLAKLREHVVGAGFDLPVDHAARDTATVGGMAATNAGGNKVMRHGSARANIAGIEAVLADGSVIRRLHGTLKDNTGYDLAGLLTGSEGTLAVITRVRLRLVPLLTERVTALLAVDGTDAALGVLATIRERATSLEAAEIIYADGLELVCAHSGLPRPFARSHAAYLLVECAARRDPTDELLAAVGESSAILDTAVARDAPSRDALWALRERHAEAVGAEGVPHKLDVSLPLSRIAEFERTVRDRAPKGARLFFWGHLGDGTMHVNVLNGGDAADELILRTAAGLGGSISAEHGIGIAKTAWLHLCRSPVEISAMRAVKRALDPEGILNPGVLLPAS